MPKYDPNCAWWDFSCTSNPSGCAWWDFLCTAASDAQKVIGPLEWLVIGIVVVVVAGLVLVAFSPVGKRLPLPRFA